MVLLQIEDERELRALYRVLVEAKFHAEPADPTLAASPWVGRLARRVSEALDPLRAPRTLRSRGAAAPPESALRLAEWQIEQCEVWEEWGREERLAFVEGVLAPFPAPAPLVEELLAKR